MPTEIIFSYFVKFTDPNIFFIVATKLIVLFLIYLPTYRPPYAPTDFFPTKSKKKKNRRSIVCQYDGSGYAKQTLIYAWPQAYIQEREKFYSSES